MNIKALRISIGDQRVGALFQYQEQGREDAQIVTDMIAAADITASQKTHMLQQFDSHLMVQSLAKRRRPRDVA